MTKPAYKEITRVSEVHDGLPVNLVLQWRLNVPPRRYKTLSWRTLLPSGKSNRRFYLSPKHGLWTVPVKVALRLLLKAQRRGMLNAMHDDRQTRVGGPHNEVIDSRALGRLDRQTVLKSITLHHGEPNWGDDPAFIVVEVPDGTWRKIVIVDTPRRFCTFRSATTDTDYGQKVVGRMDDPWMLDNSMQDAGVAMMRAFLEFLEDLYPESLA